MSKSNEKKSQFLGIPFGTACNKLRKVILFSLLKRLNENICFKCLKTIESVDELSIEHKQPWEGRDVKLFWDLDNIAFSHLRCNRPHAQWNKKYTVEQAQQIKRERTASYMRRTYSIEKRQQKYLNTGY